MLNNWRSCYPVKNILWNVLQLLEGAICIFKVRIWLSIFKRQLWRKLVCFEAQLIIYALNKKHQICDFVRKQRGSYKERHIKPCLRLVVSYESYFNIQHKPSLCKICKLNIFNKLYLSDLKQLIVLKRWDVLV